MQFECIVGKCIGGLLPFEDEQLVLFLFVSNQILAADNGEPIFTTGFLKPNDLVGLPGVGVQKLNRDLAALFESKGIKHEHLINFGDEERAHVSKFNTFRA